CSSSACGAAAPGRPRPRRRPRPRPRRRSRSWLDPAPPEPAGPTGGDGMEVVLETVVRCTEIDVNGHVNNARYVEYLEWGREEWYGRPAFPYDRLRGLGAVTAVVNLNLNLRRACRQGDRLRVVTSAQRRGRSSLVLAQRIEAACGAPVADALVTL